MQEKIQLLSIIQKTRFPNVLHIFPVNFVFDCNDCRFNHRGLVLGAVITSNVTAAIFIVTGIILCGFIYVYFFFGDIPFNERISQLNEMGENEIQLKYQQIHGTGFDDVVNKANYEDSKVVEWI